jgi:hypothetical protein
MLMIYSRVRPMPQMKNLIDINSSDFTPKDIQSEFMSWRHLEVEDATSANLTLANFSSIFDIYFNLL